MYSWKGLVQREKETLSILNSAIYQIRVIETDVKT